MNQLQPAPVRYPTDEPQIGPKKPGPRPSDCPWCNTPNCNHCRCPGYPKCDHAPNTLCSRPRYKRRLVCNPCEKHKLTKTTKKNKKSSMESMVINSNDNNGETSPALSPREKLSHEFGKSDCNESASAVITPPSAKVESTLPMNNNSSSATAMSSSSAQFVPDPSYQELVYIKEINSDYPESVISVHIYTDYLSDVRRYIETYLWDIYQRNEFKFCDKNSCTNNTNNNNNNNNNNNENNCSNNSSSSSSNNSQNSINNNNNNNKQIREIKRDQEAFTHAWDNTIEMKFPHHTSTNTLVTVRVLQIIYVDPSKSRKRVKKELNILPYPQQQMQQQQIPHLLPQPQIQIQPQNLVDPILPMEDYITTTTTPTSPLQPITNTATAIMNNSHSNINNNNNLLSPSSSSTVTATTISSSSFISSSTNPLSNLINFPSTALPPQLSPIPPSLSFNHNLQQQQQQQQQQHVVLRTIPLTAHGEILLRSPAGSSLSNTSYGFGRNRSSNDLTSYTNVLSHYNANSYYSNNNNNNNNTGNIIINNNNNSVSNRNSSLQQDNEESEWC